MTRGTTARPQPHVHLRAQVSDTFLALDKPSGGSARGKLLYPEERRALLDKLDQAVERTHSLWTKCDVGCGAYGDYASPFAAGVWLCRRCLMMFAVLCGQDIPRVSEPVVA